MDEAVTDKGVIPARRGPAGAGLFTTASSPAWIAAFAEMTAEGLFEPSGMRGIPLFRTA